MRHIFDENFPALAMQSIRQKITSVNQVGQDWGESGWLDIEQIFPHLHGLRVTLREINNHNLFIDSPDFYPA